MLNIQTGFVINLVDKNKVGQKTFSQNNEKLFKRYVVDPSDPDCIKREQNYREIINVNRRT